MEVEDVLALNTSLINLAIKCYVNETAYVDKALDYCTSILDKKGVSSLVSLSHDNHMTYQAFSYRLEYGTTAGKELYRLLKVPIDGYEDDVLTVLRLEKYMALAKVFNYEGRKALAMYLLQTVLDKDASITSLSEVRE